MKSGLSKRTRIWLLSAILCITSVGVPVRYANAQGWEVALGVASGVGGFLSSRKNNKDHKEIKKKLDEIKKQLALVDKKLKRIHDLLIALGDYVEMEFNDLYVNKVKAEITLADQNLDRFIKSPRTSRDEIRSSLTTLRTDTIALHARPPEAYDWVGAAMVYEDLLARLLPENKKLRPEIFEAHAMYFSSAISSFEEDRDWLNESMKKIQEYHDKLKAQPQILQFVKKEYRATRNCDVMQVKVYRVITGSLETSYTLTKTTVVVNDRCVIRHEIKPPGDGPRGFLSSMSAAPVGTLLPEEQPPVIPSRVVIGELEASRKDWVIRRDRVKDLEAMIHECTEYRTVAGELAKL